MLFRSYNEYAQLLEAVNPDTGKLYQPSDFIALNWNDVGTAMYQDAIWANQEKLASDPAYQALTQAFVTASLQGWIYCRDNAQECADIVTANGSKLGKSHQLWMMNEINKLIWPSPNGIGIIDEAAWAQTVGIAMQTKNADDVTIITKEPDPEAFTNEYASAADKALEGMGLNVTGTDFQPLTVTLKEGGN